MHAVAIKVNALAVQMQQLIQPLYLLIVILQGLSFNFIFFADNNNDHYHRGDNGGNTNYVATIGAVPLLNVSPTTSAATAHIFVAVLAVNTKLETPAVDTTVEATLFRNQYNSSTCYYSSSINQCTSIVNYWSMQIIDTSDIVYTLGCMLRMQKENLRSMLSMLSIHEEYCDCYLLIMHDRQDTNR